MNSDKPGARHLTKILKEKDVKHIVICPGSRNAPLIISFTSDDYFTCYSIVDERSAGFFALGLSQIQKHTVAVICTSGTALLNVGPAVAEAYYQRLPLLVISADRPIEWVNQGESQTMNQNNIFKNFIRSSFDLIQEPQSEDDLWFHDRQIAEAINDTVSPYYGPVHINIRFKEPLYGTLDEDVHIKKIISSVNIANKIERKELENLKTKWNSFERIIILCGQMFSNEDLKSQLNDLAKKGVVILTESTSNMPGNNFFPCIDKIIIPTSGKERQELIPDLLITIGGPLISRKIKTLFREENIVEHWHIDPIDAHIDAFKHLSKSINLNAVEFFEDFLNEEQKNGAFFNNWNKKFKYVEEKHLEYLHNAPFSDLKSFNFLLDKIPSNSLLHIGNSSSIRYAQLINKGRELNNFSNRGTSGIEGSVSTALGASINFEGQTFIITGDLSLLYDSNALWNNYLSPRFKIIVINNGGGGIFKIIEGPKSVPNFEKFIETKHDTDFEKLAALYGISFFIATNDSELENIWTDFVSEDNNASLLEIKTVGSENDKILKEYFDFLKSDT